MELPSDTKILSQENALENVVRKMSIVVNFFTQSSTKFQNDWAAEMDVLK